METKLKSLKKEFMYKSEILENARVILKKEFVGLDLIIDEVIEVVSTWYTLNFIQDKPLIVNLWGLTGTGKTALVNRLTELLHIENSYYRFDLGEKTGYNSFHNKISDLCDNKDDSPIIIALDEFQHARTVKGPFREELENDVNRKVWDLIDSGKVNYFDWKSGLWSFDNNIKRMKYLLKIGIEVEKGMVIQNEELYCAEMNLTFDKEKPTEFVPESYYDDIKELAGDELKLQLDSEVKALLKTLNGAQTIKFLEKVIKVGQRPTVKHFTKSLIFILGNIDEAYTMSGNFSADIDADEFHKQSLKIKIPRIKAVLRQRFRDEQIARLGNIHLIYPALNRMAYTRIIEMEIEKTLSTLKESLNISCTFDESLVSTIYKEGVYPVQGVRPVFTTIQHLLKSKLSYFVLFLVKSNKKINQIHFSVVNDELSCAYKLNETVIFTESSKLTLNLKKLRKNRQDELQTIVAVHESGHAVLYGTLMNKIPENVYSVSSDDDASGFVYANLNKDYFSKKELIPFAACMLGGIAAEELIFGEENITSGSKSDIEKVTDLVFKALKSEGFGKDIISFGMCFDQQINAVHSLEEIENEAIKIVQEAKKLAFETLTKEKELLLVLSNFLSKNSSIEKNQLAVMFEMYAETKINTKESKFYRDKLNLEMEKLIGNQSEIENLTNLLPFQLNKDTKND